MKASTVVDHLKGKVLSVEREGERGTHYIRAVCKADPTCFSAVGKGAKRRYKYLTRKSASWEGGRAALPRPVISDTERAPADLILLSVRTAVYL